MQFAFLAPLFAATLAAVVVPLLVHLVHKERKESVAFPSLMFLQRTPYQHSSRRRIRDLLLFAARCLVIALLAAAFMRPVLARTPEATLAGGGGTEVVVLLDRSLSMRYGTRWGLATAAVQQRIAALGRADRLTLVPFDDRATVVNEPSADAVRLRAALDSVRPTDAPTRLAPAVALARRMLASSTLPQKEVVVVSDFQRTAWDLGDDVRMPPGTTIVPVDVAKGDVVNRSVRAVEMRRDLSAANERVLVSARLVNSGPAVKALSARLEVNDRPVETRTVDLPADGGGAVTFAPVAVPAEGAPARVVLAEDGLARDDAFHFLLRRAPTIGVLLVEHPDAAPDRNIFVSRALAIGDQPAFEVRAVRANRVTPSDLGGRRLVLLNDAGLPPALGAERLRAFVEAGGGLVNVLGERSGPRSWPAAAAPLLPGTIGAPIDRLGERGAVLGYVDRAHPALSIFGGARSGDVSAARFFRYRSLEVASGVLARFDDGAVALAEHRVGRGRIVSWASGLDGLWNDLPRQAVFLPFLHQVAQYAAAYRSQPTAYAVGASVELNDLAAVAGDSGTRGWIVNAPDDTRLTVGGEGAPRALELRQAGWYEVRRSGAPNERPRLVAANPAPSELDFATFDPARLTNALAPEGPVAGAAAAADPEQRLVEREREQSMWWYLLVVALLVLLAEGVLASRVSQRRLQPK
jgi:Aerotolerance regulator N-terminal/von Willebrand factor type A domain